MFGQLVICAALAAAPVVASAQVFKCVSGQDVSYQSAPCEGAQVTARQWQAADYAPAPAADLQRIQATMRATGQRDAQLRRSGRSRRGTAQATTSIGRCTEAKAVRDRELYKLGPRRSIGQLRAWDGYIAKACGP